MFFTVHGFISSLLSLCVYMYCLGSFISDLCIYISYWYVYYKESIFSFTYMIYVYFDV